MLIGVQEPHDVLRVTSTVITGQALTLTCIRRRAAFDVCSYVDLHSSVNYDRHREKGESEV